MHECIQYDVMKNIFFFFLFIFLWLTILCENLINLAVILPEDGIHQFSLKHVLPGIYLAVESLKDRPDILPGWKMQVHPTNSQCSSTYGPLMAVKFKYDLNPHVFLGPVCEYAVAPVARFTQVWNIPVITAGAQSNAFTQKSDEYRLLTRINGTYKQIGHMVLQMLENFKWNIVGFLFHDNKGKRSLGRSHCYFSVEPIFRGMEEKTKVRPHYQSFDEDDSTINYNKLIQEVAQHSRIIILCASPETVYNILLAAESLKMIQSGDYVFINLDLFESKSKDFKPWHNKHHSKENNDRARVAYEALLTVTPRLPDSTEYANFSREVKKVAKEEFDFEYGNEQVNTYVTSFHEAVILYALALNDTLAAGYSADNGTHITKMMWNRTFIGITGNVSIDENGDRNADYSLLDMDPETGNFQVIANYYGATTQFINVPHKYIHWAGGRSDAPPDTPTCGFDGSGCSNNSFPEYAIVSLVMGILVCTLIIASVFIYRHYKLEAELSAMTWRIKWEDIMFGNLDKTKKIGSKLSLARNSLMSSHSTETFALQNGDKHVFAITAYYKAILVAIKKLSSSRVEITRQLLMDLKRMRDIQHDHIVRFIGACIDPPNCCIITEYCPKGSLQDILENDQIKLDWMFRYSLMHDIIKGMAYLHSSEIRTHGNLKSSNCVVDSRFVLKVTDFGLHYLRNSDENETSCSFSYWKKKLWTAPELLNLSSSSQEGTQKGDVYSFAIIMQEIIYRNGPFYVESMDFSPEEIAQKVKNKEKPSFRPTVTPEACDEELVKMVQKCWSDEPLDRPDFQTLKIVIRKLNIENESGNILDNLLSRMEQYASNLETLVHERTADYLEQKHKAEELLYQLLPKSVAEQLIRGEAVTAEAFDMVTIYFSDIVGFTALSAQSTPMQIVDFLNDLYICFDSIIEHFDVYKVETIGDAYMVVSGLPVRNDNFHANEIARMALALLKAVKKFKIRHRPAEQLKLRIGIHTGPCVAGVVGLKMPRYCLFGDTVNTASRMESNGLPLKIHVSPQTKEVLDQCKNFRLELRGEIEMKGKGKVTTYWLLGENSRFPSVNEITNEIPQAISMSTEVPQPEINKKQIRAVQIPDGLTSENTSTILGNHV